MGKKSPDWSCCLEICRLKSLHDSVVGMCSAGSSNVNILHPPSHSPVPGPGIPHPSNGQLLPALFLCVAHKRTQTYSLLAPVQLLEANYFLLSFFPCHIHFSISSFHPCLVLFLFPLSSVFSPSTTLHLLSTFLQLLADLSLFAWQSVKDADSVSRASRALPCPSRPGLRFVMLDNTLQCRDKTSATAHKKSLVFFLFFFRPPFLSTAYCTFGDADFCEAFLSAGTGIKTAEREKW